MSGVPALPTTTAPPSGQGLIHDYFPFPGSPAAGGGPLAGYRELELLVSGTANVYRYGATTDEVVVAEADRAYTTRIIVRRPIDAARFSGTVVLEIAHPEIGAGPLWPFTGPYLRASGDAHVIVTTRRNNERGVPGACR